jgi:ABC-2 type transport system permease protein
MNATVVLLTLRNLLGRRRVWILGAMPVVLLGLSVILRLTVHADSRESVAVGVLSTFALATLVPLLGLIAGTGAIGPEIDDGSIVYLLAKPLNRHSIVVSKLAVAIAVVSLFGALPMFVAGLVLTGTADRLWLGFGLGALVAGITYSALFLLLAVLTRNAVVVGLIYALVWESVVGSFVPGAQTLSIQQWSLAVTRLVVGKRAQSQGIDITAAVRPEIAIPLLIAVTVLSTAFAGSRLRSLRLTGDE